MENKQKHREPTLYIVGNPERAEEIRHIIEDEWGGKHKDYTLDNSSRAYFVDAFGYVSCCSLDFMGFKKAVANGWMKEFKLPDRPQFKPFDKVVVKIENNKWCADFYSHKDGEFIYLLGNVIFDKKCIVLPYNEETAKLIGTSDEWKGGSDE